MKHDDGEQAYPFSLQELKDSEGKIYYKASEGMTSWDHYYGLAMQAMLSNSDVLEDAANRAGTSAGAYALVAKASATMATEMIAERKRRMAP